MAQHHGWPDNASAQLQLLDDVANQDIEMQPPADDTIYVVLDTNILLDHLRILKSFVGDIVSAKAPILLIYPGIVLNELDHQKTRPGFERRARDAIDWLLRQVSRKDLPWSVVKGQGHHETCKSTRNWKTRDQEDVPSSNDDLIVDCCKYLDSKGVAVLYTRDKNLCLRCRQEGLRYVFPRETADSYTSQNLVNEIKKALPIPSYGIYFEKMTRNIEHEHGEMMIDDDHEYRIPKANVVHQQVLECFTPLFRNLTQRVGGRELENRVNSDSVSRHAPKWLQNTTPVNEWEVEDCLRYLQAKKRIVFTKPDPPLERFLRNPYSGKGALSGVEWSASAWRAAAASMRQIGNTWGDKDILQYVDSLDQYLDAEYQ